MADALASILVEQLTTVIRKEIEQKVRLVRGVRDEVKKLEDTFTTIQEVLNDAEERQINDKNVKRWLDKFKDVAYDMDDVLDEWRTEIERLQKPGLRDDDDDKQTRKKVSSFLCPPFSNCFGNVALRYDIATRIQELRARLDTIHSEKDKYNFVTSSKTTTCEDNSERQTSSIDVNVSDIFGRDLDKKIILDRLLGEGSTSNQLEIEPGPHNIISIIGMGGLGKTTLTQLVIHDHKVKTHFESTMWVCVSEPFDRTRIAQAIILEATKESTSTSEWNPLHHELRDSVKGKRFLLVLDDVWTDKEKPLDPLLDLLRHGAQGSRIMVTTRKKSVADTMNSYQYFLGILSPEDCWSLISRKAFVGTKKKENKALNYIGFEIAKKCQGLPLYASMLGSLLRKKKTESEWRYVLDSKTWELEGVDQEIFKPMLLSYDDLQSRLKHCFAYCAIFPKDKRIKKHALIKMWIAQGFINSTDPESLGEKCFDDLVESSFFQDFSKDDINDGKIISCKMHDLVHDFAQFLTKNEFYIKNNNEKSWSNYSSKARHLTLTCTHDEAELSSLHSSLCEAKSLRSLLAVLSSNFLGSPLRDDLSNVFRHLRCLRVLKLKYVVLPHLSSEIKALIHLRYLDLSYNVHLNELPDSICSLQNLQTLKLKGCKGLCKLPRGMGGMINLKHLDIRDTKDWSLPQGIGNLTSLITLSKFVLDGAGGGCKIGELKDLNLLQGDIKIKGLRRLKTGSEASVAELRRKQGLCHLELDFGTIGDEIAWESEGVEKIPDAMAVEITMESVLGVLDPHPDLKVLRITEYPGWKFPSWIASLIHLREFYLVNCPKCTELPPLGMLPSLETLYLNGLNNLKRIGNEFYGFGGGAKCFREIAFPKLKKLSIVVNNLEIWEWGDAEEIMPCVTHITIRFTKLKQLPALWKLPFLEFLVISGTEVTHIGPEFYGIGHTTSTGGGGGSVNLIAFPNLHFLALGCMLKLEQFDFGVHVGGGEEIIIMPRLTEISFEGLCSLKTLRYLSILQSLEILRFRYLDNLTDFKTGDDSILILPCLVTFEMIGCFDLKSLQHLHLPKLSKLSIESDMSMVQLPTAPNLTSLVIDSSDVAQGNITGFKKLQQLHFSSLPMLRSYLEDVRHLTELQTLEISCCDWPQDPNCIDKEGEVWSIISHIPRVIIDGKEHVRAHQPIHIIDDITASGSLICRDDDDDNDEPVSQEIDNSMVTESEPGSKLSTKVDTTSYAAGMTTRKLKIGFFILLSFLICLSVVVGGRWKILWRCLVSREF